MYINKEELNKEELKSRVEEESWYLAEQDLEIPQKVIDWAIGEEEMVHLVYLLKRWREETEVSDQELPHEKRRIVTEKRVIDLKISPNEASYKTKFLIKDIENITHDFSVNAEGLIGDKINPSFPVKIHLEGQDNLKLEPRSPSKSTDIEDLKRLLLILTDLRFS